LLSARLSVRDICHQADFLHSRFGRQLFTRSELESRFQIAVPNHHQDLVLGDLITFAYRKFRYLTSDRWRELRPPASGYGAGACVGDAGLDPASLNKCHYHAYGIA
jgi:hypothetical protein